MSAYSDLILAEAGLVSYWRLGETSGTNANDESANNLDGTYTGSPALGQPGAIVGDSDPAVSFDGGVKYVSVPDNALLKPASVSMEFWIKPAGVGDFHGFMGKTNAGWSNGYGSYYLSGKLRWFVNGYLSGAGITQVTLTANSGVWSHIVGTYDGALAKLYKNAVEVYSVAYSTAITHATEALRIGGLQDGSQSHSSFDEAALYSAALTPAQVARHYAVGRALRSQRTRRPALRVTVPDAVFR